MNEERRDIRRAYLTAATIKVITSVLLIVVCILGDANRVVADSAEARVRMLGITMSLLAVFVHGYHGMILRRAMLQRRIESRRGLYAIVRHPMYLCDLFWTFGFVVASGMATPALIMWGLVIAMIVVVIGFEERYLEATMKDTEQYDTWRASSHRLLPGIW